MYVQELKYRRSLEPQKTVQNLRRNEAESKPFVTAVLTTTCRPVSNVGGGRRLLCEGALAGAGNDMCVKISDKVWCRAQASLLVCLVHISRVITRFVPVHQSLAKTVELS